MLARSAADCEGHLPTTVPISFAACGRGQLQKQSMQGMHRWALVHRHCIATFSEVQRAVVTTRVGAPTFGAFGAVPEDALDLPPQVLQHQGSREDFGPQLASAVRQAVQEADRRRRPPLPLPPPQIVKRRPPSLTAADDRPGTSTASPNTSHVPTPRPAEPSKRPTAEALPPLAATTTTTTSSGSGSGAGGGDEHENEVYYGPPAGSAGWAVTPPRKAVWAAVAAVVWVVHVNRWSCSAAVWCCTAARS